MESVPPLFAHPGHNRLPQRLIIGTPLLAADALAAYFLIRGSIIPGIGIGVGAGFLGLFFAGKLESALREEEDMTDAERAAAVKRAGRVSRLVRSFIVAALSALVALGALPL